MNKILAKNKITFYFSIKKFLLKNFDKKFDKLKKKTKQKNFIKN